MSKLVAFNTTALLKLEALNTQSLDDFSRPRDEMATASEIAGCPRKVVMGMKYQATPSAKSLRQKRRGHILEIDMAERLIVMGFKEVKPTEFKNAPAPCFCRQLTLEHRVYPVGAHLDFTIKHKNGSLHTIECKTTDGIPNEPYPNWIQQLYVQMGLLAESFPGIEIRGSILAIDLNRGEEEEFNGFKPDPNILKINCEDIGDHIVRAKKGEIEPCCIIELYCGHCDFRCGCPAFDMPEIKVPEKVADAAVRHIEAKRIKKIAEAEIEKTKSVIEEFAGGFFKGKVGDIEIAVSSVKDGNVLDGDKLKKDHPEYYEDGSPYLKKRKGYVKTEVNQIKAKELKEKKKGRAAEKMAA